METRDTDKRPAALIEAIAAYTNTLARTGVHATDDCNACGNPLDVRGHCHICARAAARYHAQLSRAGVR